MPARVVEARSKGKKPPVKVTVNVHTYRSTVATMGGRFLIGLNAANRKVAGVEGGKEVPIRLELDTHATCV